MKIMIHSFMSTFRQLWRNLRTLSGDDAYERYFQQHRCTHAMLPALSRKAYFRNAQQSSWDQINRCC